MTPREIRNMAASVHQRLKNHAHATGRYFNEVLLTYGIERFLYRLSVSPGGTRFVLKGGLMLMVWRTAIHRPTRDIDLLGHMPNQPDMVAAAISDACVHPVEEDGLVFDPDTIATAPIGTGREFEGVRVTFEGRLARAVIHMQVDVGFGDAVVPGPQEVEVPSTLGFPAARMLAYPPEALVAETLHAMVERDEANSRVRDFLDVWLVSRQFRFSGDRLRRAVEAAFATRGTEVSTTPFGFTAAFAEDTVKQTMWSRFLERNQIEGAPTSLAEVVSAVADFLRPVLQALAASGGFTAVWEPPGPWREGS